ncbi:MAG: sterol desaturase family protein [Acidobacteriia bacterium]|nr:sterol desaturase family protein [Terriglobia bacterium]
MPWERIESYSYWILFVATFLGVAVWESFRPKQELSGAPGRRWGRHGLVLIVCTVISVGLYLASPVVVAIAFAGNRYGLLNKPWIPFVVRCILAVLLLDFVKYAVHRTFHSVSFLWRVHQVHHSDPDFDVSTATRVHPIEVVLSQGAYFAVIAIFAPPVIGVLVAELVSAFQSFFGHANASLPGWAEKPLRRLFVTPDMHRIHHSEAAGEQCTNYGDCFPWWDRLFRTYLAEPAAGQDRMVVGLKGFQNDASLGLAFMLTQPFLPEKKEQASRIASAEQA